MWASVRECHQSQGPISLKRSGKSHHYASRVSGVIVFHIDRELAVLSGLDDDTVAGHIEFFIAKPHFTSTPFERYVHDALILGFASQPRRVEKQYLRTIKVQVTHKPSLSHG